MQAGGDATNGSADGVRLNLVGMAALLACGLFTTIGLFSPALVLPQIAQAFAQVPNARLLSELVGTVASFSFAISAPAAGALIARFGCRRVIVPALVLFALAGALPALLDNIWAILATRVVVGVALAPMFIGGLAGIGVLHLGVRMRMLGWYSVVGGAAAIVMFPVVGILGVYGWRPAFLLHLVALPVAALVLTLPAWLGRVAPRADAASDHAAPGSLLSPAMLGVLLLSALVGVTMVIPSVYTPIYLSSLGITNTTQLAVPVTCSSISAVITAIFYGRLHKLLGVNGVWLVSLPLAGLGMIGCGSTASVPVFTVAIVLVAAATTSMAANVSAASMALVPAEKAAQAMGLGNGVMFGSQLLVPFLAAWLRDLVGLGGMFVAIGLAGMVAAALAALTMTLGRRQRANVLGR